MSGQLEIWAVYERPTDYPDYFVARKFVGENPTDEVLWAYSLKDVRQLMQRMGLVSIGRSHNDDPVIVEVWL